MAYQAPLVASFIATALFAAGLGGVAVYLDDAPEASFDDQHAGHNHAYGTSAVLYGFELGQHRYDWPEATGSVPTASTATSLEEVHHIRIIGDEGFNPSNGVRGGSGTFEDPFVISGYYVTGDLYIQDTDACFIIKENYIGGQLSLNWNGDCVWVHHNHIDDLRVNENIRRLADLTTGLIEFNTIEFVGQIRHYDGIFASNTVGPRDDDSMWDSVMETTPIFRFRDTQVMNIDGYNQGIFEGNTFVGSVDIDLHGHHHSTGYDASHSHYHGEEMDRKMPHDHTDRWHSVYFVQNTITDPTGYGLRVEDRNHRGDDVEANSEQEESLRMPHTHKTRIVVADNIIDGPLWVDVFNADDDELHLQRNPGELQLIGNHVTLHEREPESFFGLGVFTYQDHIYQSAISIYAAKEVVTVIKGNVATYVPLEDDNSDSSPVDMLGWGGEEVAPAAIRLDRFHDASITIESNVAEGFQYGIFAHELDNEVAWQVSGNDFTGVAQDIYWDDSVANQPNQ